MSSCSSTAKLLSSPCESRKSDASALNDSNSSSLPSEYYVPDNASINSRTISESPEWSSISGSCSYQNNSSAVTIHSSDTQEIEQTCCDYVSFTPRRFLASSKFRKCPHSLRLLLVYYMFLLVGFIERGSFLVLFYSLISYDRFSPPQLEAVYLAVRGFVTLLYPLLGFISDTYFGQYKVMLVCVNIVWIGSAVLAAGFTKMDPIFDALNNQGVWSTGSVVLMAVGYTIIGWGLAGIKVNLIPFGVDQIPDASSGELSSYFHWYYWFLVGGQLLATLTLPYIYVYSYLSYVFLLMNTVVTVFIAVLVWSSPKLHIHSKIGNSLKLVINVTRCALTMRRRPGFWSAFHVGKRLPSMMDKATTEYGGRYSVEQVEDVKTFYRIMFILISFIGYFAIFSQIETTSIFQGSRLRQQFTDNCSSTTLQKLSQITEFYANSMDNKLVECSLKSVPSSVGYAAANLFLLLIMIPLFDRVLYVCLNGWKWFSMLGRIGIGKVLILMSITCALVVEIVRHTVLQTSLRQMGGTIVVNAIRFHTDQAHSLYITADLSSYWLWPQYILFSFAKLFCNITAVEFIYAQSPSAMKGLLLGLFFATEGVSMMLSSLLMVILDQLPEMTFCSYFTNAKDSYTELLTGKQCTGGRIALTSNFTNSTISLNEHAAGCMDSAICTYIIFIIVAIVSTVIFAIAACRYKFRKRDPDPVFPFWLYPESQKKRNVCVRALRLLCCCIRDKDWQI